VGECLHAAGLTVPVLQLGLPDRFIEHGDPAKLLASAAWTPPASSNPSAALRACRPPCCAA
jgi:deoxyxylulose-5-phosphate synthase